MTETMPQTGLDTSALCPSCGKDQMPEDQPFTPCKCTQYEWLFREADIPPKYLQAQLTPSQPQNNAQLAALKRATQFLNGFALRGKGLYLSGDKRTGKTYVAAAIANTLIRQKGRHVQWWSMPDLLFDLRTAMNNDTYGDLAAAIVNRAQSAQLCILDDIGAERDTDYAAETVATIIRRRNDTGRPCIFTSQWPLRKYPGVSETLLDRYDGRIVERIRESTVELYLGRGTNMEEKS